jgi:REP element-mobilizing transposase RayT
VLANAQAWQICRAVFDKLDEWRILSAIAMPDHLHVLAAPASRDASISDSQNGLNAGSTKRISLRIADRLCQMAP